MLEGTLGRMSSVKLPCPRLDMFERYADWRKAYNFWSAATGLCDRSKAAEVLACVANATENYPGDLVSKVMDSLSWEQVGNPDVKDILEFLDKTLGEDKKHAAWRTYAEFEECVIKPGERYEDFTTRFETAWDAARRENNTLEMSGGTLAMKLEFAAKLEPHVRMVVDQSTKGDKAGMFKRAVRAVNEIHEGMRFRGMDGARMAAENGREEEIHMDRKGRLYRDGRLVIEQREGRQKNGTSENGNGEATVDEDSGEVAKTMRVLQKMYEDGPMIFEQKENEQRSEMTEDGNGEATADENSGEMGETVEGEQRRRKETIKEGPSHALTLERGRGRPRPRDGGATENEEGTTTRTEELKIGDYIKVNGTVSEVMERIGEATKTTGERSNRYKLRPLNGSAPYSADFSKIECERMSPEREKIDTGQKKTERGEEIPSDLEIAIGDYIKIGGTTNKVLARKKAFRDAGGEIQGNPNTYNLLEMEGMRVYDCDLSKTPHEKTTREEEIEKARIVSNATGYATDRRETPSDYERMEERDRVDREVMMRTEFGPTPGLREIKTVWAPLTSSQEILEGRLWKTRSGNGRSNLARAAMKDTDEEGGGATDGRSDDEKTDNDERTKGRRGGWAILDTCCNASMAGKTWLEDYLRKLPEIRRREISGPYPTDAEVTFGAERQHKSLAEYEIPVSLHNETTKIRVQILDMDIPLMISGEDMKKAGAIIDLKREKIILNGTEREMSTNEDGHPVAWIIPDGRGDGRENTEKRSGSSKPENKGEATTEEKKQNRKDDSK